MNVQTLKTKSLAQWLVIGILGTIAIVTIVFAANVLSGLNIENCNDCQFVVQGGEQSGESQDLGASGTRWPNGVSADTTSPVAGELRGATLTLTGAANVAGTLNYTESSESQTTTNTIAISESGKTFYFSGSNYQTVTLPATTTPGQVYRFYVGGALSASTTVVTAGSVNSINGTMIVNGAVVDCDDEDKILFEVNSENIGDFIELRTDGTDWFIGASGALSSGAMTCTAT